MRAELQRLAAVGATRDEVDIIGMLQDSLGRYCADHVTSSRIDREHQIPRRILDDLAGMGLFGLSIPEQYGGTGLSLQAVCSVIQGLAQRDRSVATTLGLHLGLGSRGLVRYGSDALKETYLPRMASGERLAACAVTEPGAGSDLMAIATRGILRGGRLVVDGSKLFVTNGGLASVFTVAASTPGLGGARGHSLLLLQLDDAGLEVGPEEDKLGIRGSSTTTLHFDEMDVPLDRVIGTPGKAMDHLAHILAWGRTVMAAGCTGTARAAFEIATRHVTERTQFRRTLASFDVVRQQVADMAALAFAMESMVRRTTIGADDDKALAFRSTATKMFCSDSAWEICDTGVQLLGGSGFIEETGLALLLRDCRITRIFEGANDVLAQHAGSMEAFAPLPRTPLPEEVGDTPLARRGDVVGGLLAHRREQLLEQYGIRLARQQRLLHQFGRLAVSREACDAVVLRAHAEDTPLARAHALHFLTLAEQRIAAVLGGLPDMGAVDAVAASYLGDSP